MTWDPWPVLLLLGAGHGLNPGMGWLFAVALGLQEGRTRAVWRTLGPLAVGHALAVVLAVALAAMLGTVVPASLLKWLVALVLLGFGLYRAFMNKHPRFGGMRVSSRDLALWSFLMASAHGAGLMVVPVLLAAEPATASLYHEHGVALLEAGVLRGPALRGLLATAVHTAGYLLLTGGIAVVVYRKLGLRLLRTAWINLDLIWAAALVVTAIVIAL